MTGLVAPAARQSLGAETLVKIRVAGVPLDVSAIPYYALDHQVFAKNGLDAEIIPAASGAAIAPAVLGGSVDFGTGNTTVLATSHERGLPFVMVAPSGAYLSSAPTAALVVAPNSPTPSCWPTATITLQSDGSVLGDAVAVD